MPSTSKSNKDGAIINKTAYMVIGIDLDGNKDVLGSRLARTSPPSSSLAYWMNWTIGGFKTSLSSVWTTCLGSLKRLRPAIPKQNLKVYYSPNPQFHTVRFVQGSKEGYCRLKAHLQGRYRRRSLTWTRPFWRGAESQISAHPPFLAEWLGGVSYLFKYPTDEALLKMLYLATVDVTRKWTGRVQNWGQMLLQLSVFFPDRVGQHLRWIATPPRGNLCLKEFTQNYWQTHIGIVRIALWYSLS